MGKGKDKDKDKRKSRLPDDVFDFGQTSFQIAHPDNTVTVLVTDKLGNRLEKQCASLMGVLTHQEAKEIVTNTFMIGAFDDDDVIENVLSIVGTVIGEYLSPTRACQLMLELNDMAREIIAKRQDEKGDDD